MGHWVSKDKGCKDLDINSILLKINNLLLSLSSNRLSISDKENIVGFNQFSKESIL